MLFYQFRKDTNARRMIIYLLQTFVGSLVGIEALDEQRPDL
jgi:predicted membrane-bound spermidine synthase